MCWLWKRGELLAENYSKIRVENGNVSLQRRAMSKAFARQLVTDNEMTQINAIMKKYYAESIDAVNRVGKDGPTTFNKHGIVNETRLKALAEALKEVQANSVYGRS